MTVGSPDLRRAILDLTVEDYYGLWELCWRAHTLWPGAGDALDAAVRSEVEAMIDEELLEAFELPDETPLSLEKARRALHDDASWDPTSDTGIRVSATDVGENAYRRGA